MTEREELEKILLEHFDCSMDDAVDEIYSWRNRHKVKVEREQIEDKLRQTHNHSGSCKDFEKYGSGKCPWKRAIDDLLFFLNGEKVSWCEHIIWKHDCWWYNNGEGQMGNMTRLWDRCPIRGCGKERPKE